MDDEQWQLLTTFDARSAATAFPRQGRYMTNVCVQNARAAVWPLPPSSSLPYRATMTSHEFGAGGSIKSLSFDRSPGLPAQNLCQIFFEEELVWSNPDSAERIVLYWQRRSDPMVVVDHAWFMLWKRRWRWKIRSQNSLIIRWKGIHRREADGQTKSRFGALSREV